MIWKVKRSKNNPSGESKNPTEKYSSGDIGIDRRMILNCILN